MFHSYHGSRCHHCYITGGVIQYTKHGDLKQLLNSTDEQSMQVIMYADDIALLTEDAACLKALARG